MLVVNHEFDSYNIVSKIMSYGSIPKQTQYTNTKIVNIDGYFTIAEDDTFILFQYLENIYLPDILETIGNAFIYQSKVKEIFLPKSVNNLAVNHPFDLYLENIIVDEENEYYSSIDGVLFTKDKKGFFFYPSVRKEETYTIPESVERIGS